MAQTNVEKGKDLEDLSTLKLDPAAKAELLGKQTECSVIFLGEDGWPRGVIMSFLEADDCFWLTAIDGRVQTLAIERDPSVSIMVSNAGNGSVGLQILSVRVNDSVNLDL